MRIAFLGAGSHVARALARYWASAADIEIISYTRTPDILRVWAAQQVLPLDRFQFRATSDFPEMEMDAVINFIGAGDPRLVRRLGAAMLPLTQEWDRRALDWLRGQSNSRYIFLSSGAATGETFVVPRAAGAPVKVCEPTEFYGAAKADAERLHRASGDLPIVDLRLFSFFSTDIPVDATYLMSDVVRAIGSQEVLLTDEHNIKRDYIHPSDLAAIIRDIIGADRMNAAFDVYSRGAVAKFDLLHQMEVLYGLKWRMQASHKDPARPNYYSLDRSLRLYGYEPHYDSLGAIREQMDLMFRS